MTKISNGFLFAAAHQARFKAVWLAFALNLVACGDDDESDTDWPDAAGDTTSATASNTGDIGSTTHTGTGTGTTFDPNESEEEDSALLTQPVVSGPFVFQMSRSQAKVAVIHSQSLEIKSVQVGYVPTQMVALSNDLATGGDVAVLGRDPLRAEVAMIHVDVNGEAAVVLHEVVAGANAMVVDPTRRYVVVYHDVDAATPLGAGSDQELSVLDTQVGKVYNLSVGAHPREVSFTPDGSMAYIVTADGVNLLELAAVASSNKLVLVPVIPAIGLDPQRVEVKVAPALGQAIARTTDHAQIWVTDLQTQAVHEFALPSVATDLDIAGQRVYAILPGQPDSQLVEVELPVTAASQARTLTIANNYVGLAHFSSDGESALLYTSRTPSDSDDANDPRQRLTIARRGSGDWIAQQTLFTEIPIREIGIAPDDRSAILFHTFAPTAKLGAPWAYTLLDLAAAFPLKKMHTSIAQPIALLFTPDADRAAILLRDDTQGVKGVDLVAMGTFVVTHENLASPPERLGYVAQTDRIFVSQVHPSGRMTFVDAAGRAQTITGFENNDGIKD